MGTRLTFARDFAWPIVITTGSVFIVGWGAMSDAYSLWTAGLPEWAFTLLGLGLFLVGFVVALYTVVTKFHASALANTGEGAHIVGKGMEPEEDHNRIAELADTLASVAAKVENLERLVQDYADHARSQIEMLRVEALEGARKAALGLCLVPYADRFRKAAADNGDGAGDRRCQLIDEFRSTLLSSSRFMTYEKSMEVAQSISEIDGDDRFRPVESHQSPARLRKFEKICTDLIYECAKSGART